MVQFLVQTAGASVEAKNKVSAARAGGPAGAGGGVRSAGLGRSGAFCMSSAGF